MKPFIQYLREYRFTLQYHETLNQKLWDGDKLRPGIAPKILKLAYEFAEFSGVDKKRIKDIVITGGNVNYNYTPLSDVDCHLICNTKGLDSDALFDKKREWGHSRNDRIKGYELEMFIQSETEEAIKGQGVYSILNDKWVVKPKHLDHIEALEDPYVAKKIEHYIDRIKDVLKSNSEKDRKGFLDKMRKMRAAGLHSKGEFSVENIIFKELRNSGWLKKLKA